MITIVGAWRGAKELPTGFDQQILVEYQSQEFCDGIKQRKNYGKFGGFPISALFGLMSFLMTPILSTQEKTHVLFF